MFKYILLLFVSSNAFAVQTSKCPESLKIELQDLQIFSKNFVEELAQERDWVDYQTVEAFQAGEINDLVLETKLAGKANSVCDYAFEPTTDITYASVRLTGTDAKPLLKIYFSTIKDSTYNMYAVPTAKEPTYVMSGAVIQIKANATVQAYDEPNWPKELPIGKAIIK